MLILASFEASLTKSPFCLVDLRQLFPQTQTLIQVNMKKDVYEPTMLESISKHLEKLENPTKTLITYL